MRSFYLSSFIKIQSAIRKINLPPFRRFLLPPVPQMFESEMLEFVIKSICAVSWQAYQFSSSEHAQKHKTRQSSVNLPLDSPKESRSGPFITIKYLGLTLILPTKFHSDLSTLSFFQDFHFPRQTPPNITRSGWDSKSEFWDTISF